MNYRRILIFKPGAIGDLLQLSPVVRALRQKFPQSSITLVVGSEASIDLYRYNPDVTEIIVYDKRGAHRTFRGFLDLWRHLRRRRFDLVINYQRSNLKGWGLVSASFPARMLVYQRDDSIHAVDNHLKPLELLGIDPSNVSRDLVMHLGDDDRKWSAEAVSSLGAGNRPLVALNPGASHPVNRWPVEKHAALAERLVRDGLQPVLVGGREDRSLADAVHGALSLSIPDFVGRTSLLQLGALLERAELLVSGDTGPMHLATAVGTPVVALFGAADPHRTGPVGEGHWVLTAREVPCVPCRSRVCRHEPFLECMMSLSVDDVASTILSHPAIRGHG